MEPDYTAKYNLPMLIDLTENLIHKNNFLCIKPLTVLRVFLHTSRYSEFTHVVFFSQKQILTKI
jgi:hypothetical protein